MSFPEVHREKPKFRASQLWASLALFFVGLFFIGLCIYFLFGRIATEDFDPATAATQITSGRAEMRLPLAREWIQHLAGHPKFRPTEHQSEEFWRVFEANRNESSGGDLRLQSALLTLISFSENPAVALGHFKNLATSLHPEADAENDLHFYFLLGLRRLLEAQSPQGSQDSELAQASAAWLKSPTTDLKGTAAFALTGFKDLNVFGPLKDTVHQELSAILETSDATARLNAATAMVHFGLPEGLAHLKKFLQEALGPKGKEPLTEAELSAYREVFRSVKLSGDPEARILIKKISDSHPNLKLRQLAKEFIF